MNKKDKVWIYFNSLDNSTAVISISETKAGYKW